MSDRNQKPISEASIAFEVSRPVDRDKLIFDPRFRLRYTMMIVGLCALLMLALGSVIVHFLREASEVVAVRAMDPTDTQAVALQRELLRTDRIALIALFASGCLLVVIIAAGGLFVTRKVAEPLFKIAFHMSEIALGRLSPIRPLRAGDHLREFFATFQRMHEALGKRAREESAVLAQVIDELERSGQSKAAEPLRRLKRDKDVFGGS